MPKHAASNGMTLKPQKLLGADQSTLHNKKKPPRPEIAAWGQWRLIHERYLECNVTFSIGLGQASFEPHHFCRPYQSLTSFVA